MPRRKDALNVGLFRKCIAHIGGANDGESENGMRIACKMCVDAGMTFSDGCAIAYGTSDSTELQDTIEGMTARITELETENAALREGTRLMEDQLNAHLHPPRKGGFRGLLKHAWGLAPYRLLLLAMLIGARMVMFTLIDSTPFEETFTRVVNWLFLGAGGFLFVKWAGLQYEQSGIGAVSMKVIILGGLSTLAAACLFGFCNWRLWFGLPCAAEPFQYSAFAIMATAGILSVSNFAERLADKAQNSNARLFAVVREILL